MGNYTRAYEAWRKRGGEVYLRRGVLVVVFYSQLPTPQSPNPPKTPNPPNLLKRQGTGRQRGKDSERQRSREAESQGDRETEGGRVEPYLSIYL